MILYFIFFYNYNTVKMLLNYLIQLYIYFTNYICPSIFKKNFASITSKNNSVGDTFIFDSIYEAEFENENEENKKNTLIIDINTPEYYYSTTNLTSRTDSVGIESKHLPISRSKSMKIPRYICGYCNTRINTPTYLYSDNVFCNLLCRDKRIQIDNSSKTRMIHSFSV